MDLRLREAARGYNLNPSLENLIRLLTEQLRSRVGIDLNSEAINEHWEEPKLKLFLKSAPKQELKLCEIWRLRSVYPPDPVGTLRFLLRNRITYQFDYDYDVCEIGEAKTAYNGEYSIMEMAFRPDGAGLGELFLIIQFDEGFTETFVRIECDDIRDWEVENYYVDTWASLGLNYTDTCDLNCDLDQHIGTEEHVHDIDMARVDTLRLHFLSRLGEVYLPDNNYPSYCTYYNDFLDLNYRNV